MPKHNGKQVLAVTEAARRAGQIAVQSGLASREIARLEAEAASIHASESERRADRSLRLISSENGFSALIKHGNKTFQFEGDSFAVTTHD